MPLARLDHLLQDFLGQQVWLPLARLPLALALQLLPPPLQLQPPTSVLRGW